MTLNPNEYVKSSRVLNPIESTTRRAGNFLKSFVLAFIGLLLFFLAAPYLLFLSEFQYTSQHFSAAVMANAASPATGYVYVYGAPLLVSANPCRLLPEKQCLYYDYTKEVLTIKQRVVCGSDAEDSNVEKVSSAPDECNKKVVREGGQDVEKEVCEKCWNAKVKEWEVVDDKTSTPEFKVGVNTVTPNSKTDYMGELGNKKSEYDVNGTKYREEMRYIEQTSAEVLAVGSAKNGVISSGDPFVVSTKNFEATKEIVAQKQASAEFFYKLLGFLAYLIGVVFILSPIPAFIEIAGGIPWVGDVFVGLGKITGFIMYGIALVVAIVMTILLTIVFKIMRFLSDNVLVIIFGAIVVGGIVLFALGTIFKGKKEGQ